MNSAYQAGYAVSFVAGMLGNVCREGDVGQFERYNANNPQSYILAIPAKYDYIGIIAINAFMMQALISIMCTIW